MTKIIHDLKKFGGIFSVQHVTSFLCYRKAKDGTTQRVLIEILDAGEDASRDSRFTVVAKSANGKETSGNPFADIRTALANVHWQKLD